MKSDKSRFRKMIKTDFTEQHYRLYKSNFQQITKQNIHFILQNEFIKRMKYAFNVAMQ